MIKRVSERFLHFLHLDLCQTPYPSLQASSLFQVMGQHSSLYKGYRHTLSLFMMDISFVYDSVFLFGLFYCCLESSFSLFWKKPSIRSCEVSHVGWGWPFAYFLYSILKFGYVFFSAPWHVAHAIHNSIACGSPHIFTHNTWKPNLTYWSWTTKSILQELKTQGYKRNVLRFWSFQSLVQLITVNKQPAVALKDVQTLPQRSPK